MLVLGSIGDKYSRRGALVTGLLIFAGGSVMGSLVHRGLVIAARATMGVGAAVVMPATLSLLVAIFPKHERARAITAWTATSGLASRSARWSRGGCSRATPGSSTFLINVPIAVLAVVGALVLVPPSKAARRSASTTWAVCSPSSRSAASSTRSSRARTSAGAPDPSPRPSPPPWDCPPSWPGSCATRTPCSTSAKVRPPPLQRLDDGSAVLLLRHLRLDLLRHAVPAVRPRLQRAGDRRTTAAAGRSRVPRRRGHRTAHPPSSA
ncbi:MFS transporter [Streptomyces sp. L7]